MLEEHEQVQKLLPGSSWLYLFTTERERRSDERGARSPAKKLTGDARPRFFESYALLEDRGAGAARALSDVVRPSFEAGGCARRTTRAKR